MLNIFGRPCRHWWSEFLFRGKGDIPKAVGGVAFSGNDDSTILVYLDIVFGEKSDVVIIV